MAPLIEIDAQQRFWNSWNTAHREKQLDEVPRRQAAVVRSWLDELAQRPLDLLEVGCGAGWFCQDLSEYGRVTATDLSDEVLARARLRTPQVDFVAGDFMALDFGQARYDAVIALDVLSHVAEQGAFLAKIAEHLRPGGVLMLATQNRPVLQRHNNIPPPGPGQLRNWVDSDQLRRLLEPEFAVERLFSVTPRANRGFMRIVNSRKLNRPVRMVLGDSVERIKERLGLGWTLMARARRRE